MQYHRRTKNAQFVEQVQMLMHVQQIKCAQNNFEETNYSWLSNRKQCLIWLSTKDEYLIYQGLNKITDDQKCKVITQLVIWLNEHTTADPLKVPQVCIDFLHNIDANNILHRATISRMDSFRNSLRRLSNLSNKISPENMILTQKQTQPTRSAVTFDEHPIYCIYKN